MSNTTAKNFLHQKKILSIDYGTKVTGLAYLEFGVDFFPATFGKIITPHDSVRLEKIQKLVREHKIDVIVIGVPRFTDGKETSMTKKVMAFKNSLQKNLKSTMAKFSLPNREISIFTQDETLSSFEAESRMKNSPLYNFSVDYGKIDEVSAAIILEDFLNGLNH